ncbi:MAG TPA: serine kinase [Prolixibacteraceae bacterium]|nr:serine kinase [Prolixibacteraceae bacterium]
MNMKVSELAEALGLKVWSGSAGLDHEITGGYVSDLLSDVMGFARRGEVWITLQTHKNVLAVASLKELAAVILVKGLSPDEESILHSEEEAVPLLGTPLSAFEVTGKIFQLLNPRPSL